jgi:hypothetical protein
MVFIVISPLSQQFGGMKQTTDFTDCTDTRSVESVTSVVVPAFGEPIIVVFIRVIRVIRGNQQY